MGLALAQWMVEGEVERDPRGFDVARFGGWTTPGYTVPKVIENYRMRFSVTYPNEERPAARPFRTTAMYDIFDRMGAVWGQQYGLEVANYFAAEGEPRAETPTFRRSDAWDAVAREVRAVRERRRHQRDPELRQVPGQRARGARVAGPHHGRPDPCGGADLAQPDAGRERAARRRLHRHQPWRRPLSADRQLRRAGLARALVPPAPRCRGGGRERLRHPHRLPDRGAAGARAAGARHPRRRGGAAVPRWPADDGRDGRLPGAARQLYRRSRLRAVLRRDQPAAPVGRAVGRGAAIWGWRRSGCGR